MNWFVYETYGPKILPSDFTRSSSLQAALKTRSSSSGRDSSSSSMHSWTQFCCTSIHTRRSSPTSPHTAIWWPPAASFMHLALPLIPQIIIPNQQFDSDTKYLKGRTYDLQQSAFSTASNLVLSTVATAAANGTSAMRLNARLRALRSCMTIFSSSAGCV